MVVKRIGSTFLLRCKHFWSILRLDAWLPYWHGRMRCFCVDAPVLEFIAIKFIFGCRITRQSPPAKPRALHIFQ
jgi:hypothetical protein